MTVASLNALPFAKPSDRDHVADGLRNTNLRNDRDTLRVMAGLVPHVSGTVCA